MQQRVVFLDIDGVLNTPEYTRKANNSEVMDPVTVAILRRLVETTKAAIVISSSWRHGANWKKHIQRVFSQSGWDNPPIIDRTPKLSGGRGREIAAWLTEHQAMSFIIVDDIVWDLLPEQAEHIIECDKNVGFTEQNAQEILRRWT